MNVVFTEPLSGMETERDFMRAHGKKQEGQRNVLPPQIFNGEKYCGVGIIFVSGTVSRNFSPVSCKKNLFSTLWFRRSTQAERVCLNILIKCGFMYSSLILL
jgi:hypothetical protein